MRYLLSSVLFTTLAAAADKPALAVVQKISGTVGFYSADGKHLKDVKVGTHPHEIVLSRDKRYAYVSDNGILWMQYAGEGGNTISVIDLAGMKKDGVISLGNNRRPHGMDVHPKTGHLVVTTENPDGLVLVDPVKRAVIRRYDVKGADPHMVILDRSGDFAYVSNTGSNNVAAIHLESGNVKLVPVEAPPQGGVFSHDAKLLYMTGDGAISIIDTAKKEKIGSFKVGPGAARIALSPDGRTLIYNLGENGNAIAFADVAARKETQVVRLISRPLSMVLTADGKLAYLGIQDKDKIVVMSAPDRKIVKTIDTPKDSGPDSILPLP